MNEKKDDLPPTVLTMVRDRLIDDGYDGLYCDDCGCDLEQLVPCDDIGEDCRAGYKVECDCGECKWHIAPRRKSKESFEHLKSEREEVPKLVVLKVAELIHELTSGLATEIKYSEALQRRVKELEAEKAAIPSCVPPAPPGADRYQAYQRQDGESWQALCRRTGQQNCGDCEDLNCGDNLKRRLAQREDVNDER